MFLGWFLLFAFSPGLCSFEIISVDVCFISPSERFADQFLAGLNALTLYV